MDIEDVDITYADASIVGIHVTCMAVVEQWPLSVSLQTIVTDVEGSDHECEPS